LEKEGPSQRRVRIVSLVSTVLKRPNVKGWRNLSNYATGRRLEYRIRDIFRREGYLVIRAAQSKPVDLVCMRGGKSFLIECKTDRSFLGKDRKKELLGMSEQAGMPIILAKRTKRKVELTNLSDGKLFDPKNLAATP